jgi:predicted acetyltransferase
VDIEYRVPEADEWAAFIAPVGVAFGGELTTQADLDAEESVWERERSIGALDGGRWVGGTGAFTFDLTLPGGTTISSPGVTMVGVLPTHRRRGILTELMSRQLDDLVEQGEAVAMLTASESAIYGRYGYGIATTAARIHLGVDRARFAVPVEVPGSFELLPTTEAAGPLKAAYDRCLLRRAGIITRSERYWQRMMLDLESWRGGAGPYQVVVHRDTDRNPDGYLLYRIKDEWTSVLPQSKVLIRDLGGVDDEVEAAMWQFALSVDLVAEVVGQMRPLDEPIRWRLTEPRRMTTSDVADHLWMRVLDVPVALAARRYRVEDGLVIEVIDRFRPAGGGRFRLDGGPDGATCTRTDASADLTLGSTELASLYLGGVTPSALAAANRIDEHTSGALARADLLFPTTLQPFCSSHF